MAPVFSSFASPCSCSSPQPQTRSKTLAQEADYPIAGAVDQAMAKPRRLVEVAPQLDRLHTWDALERAWCAAEQAWL
jgi:hypothetical protein